MSLSPEEIRKIAHLARLEVDASALSHYQKDLSNILDLIAQMDRVDTNGTEPMAHPLETIQRLRNDQITETDQHELFQKLAPAVVADLYLVPQVIE
jgi:aspartyl-tRNA(Asn)/glutamyl-tRNA(Gln) amidotransferase subunit C